MRRFFLGLLLLNLFGAIAGAVLTWPGSTSDPEKNSPTLSEFQTGVRISLRTDAAKQPYPASAARPERRQRDATTVGTPPTPAVGDSGRPLDSDRRVSPQSHRVASIASAQQMLSVGENVPEADTSWLAASHGTSHMPRQGELLRKAILLASIEPAQAVTLAAANAPEPGPPDVPAGPATIADTVRQDDISTKGSGPAVEIAQQRGRHADDAGAGDSHQTHITIRHVDHVSIHYHGDARSRTDAQHISNRLGSSGLSAIEMHTTAHVIPVSMVRYFSRRDAPAAISLAKGLGSKATDWRVDDCTAYQHKPDRGTIQIWPATPRTSP